MRASGQSDIEREMNTTIDLRPSELLPATCVEVRVNPGGRGLVSAQVLVNGVYAVSCIEAPTVGRALMNAGALMAGIEVVPNVELRRKPWWRR